MSDRPQTELERLFQEHLDNENPELKAYMSRPAEEDR